jgi:hypothetical protein
LWRGQAAVRMEEEWMRRTSLARAARDALTVPNPHPLAPHIGPAPQTKGPASFCEFGEGSLIWPRLAQRRAARRAGPRLGYGGQ